jgi:hypothetical protein
MNHELKYIYGGALKIDQLWAMFGDFIAVRTLPTTLVKSIAMAVHFCSVVGNVEDL